MWILALALAAAPPAVAARPDGTVTSPLVQVLMGQGLLKATPRGGGEFSIGTGMQLGAEDTLQVPDDAWVTLLVLKNGLVTRIEDLTIRVGDLAVLTAKAPTNSFDAQLNALLTAEERKAAPRLAGWVAGQTAANVPGTQPEKKRKAFGREGGGGESKSALDGESKLEAEEAPKTSPGPTKTKQTLPTPVPASKLPAPAPPPPASDAPGRVIAAPIPTALQTCLTKHLSQLGPDTRAALNGALVIKWKNPSTGARVRLGGGVPVPVCALTWAGTQPLSDSWVEWSVPLQ